MKHILCWIFPLISLFASVPILCQRVNAKSEDRQWHMVKDFGKKHNVNNWILYHDPPHSDSYWKKIWFNALKNEYSLGYFIMDIPKFHKSFNSTKVARLRYNASLKNLHLYVHPDLESINKLIDAEALSALNSNQHSTNFWLIRMPKNEKKDKCLDLLINFQIGFNNKIFCFFLNDTGNVEVSNVLKDDEKSDTILKPYSVWKNNNAILDRPKDILPPRHHSLEGSHLRVVSAYSPPAVTYIEDGCTSKDCFKGIFANILHDLSDKMNFTYTINRAYMWGSVTNGTWNGMVGMLKNGKADIAATDLTITNERSGVVDFLPSLMETTEELYMKNPGDAFSTVSYIGAFTKTSWKAIGFWIIMMPLILLGILKKTICGNQEGIGLFDCFLFVSASLVHLKYNLNLRKARIRIAFISAVIGGSLIFHH